MALHGITEAEAFAKLSADSQNSNIKLAVLARNIVDAVAANGTRVE